MDFFKVIWQTAKEILQTALISFGIFLVVYLFLVQPHKVQGISMQPSFENGELLLTEKISYRITKPKRDDVIVFQAPIAKKADFIKRIIGLPGDTVIIRDGKVYINGIVLDEKYIKGETQGNIELTLGKNEYFVLGDNRMASSDSRAFGPIGEDLIRGKVWFVYWPLFKKDGVQGIRFISNTYNGITNHF